jgi:hypothetical protein
MGRLLHDWVSVALTPNAWRIKFDWAYNRTRRSVLVIAGYGISRRDEGAISTAAHDPSRTSQLAAVVATPETGKGEKL